MCGRFAITLPPEAMRRLFAYAEQPNFPPRYNIAPTEPIPIVRAARNGAAVARHFQLMRWGFIPSFVRNPREFPLVFNARREGLADKASFRHALRRRRCLIPADAFYEWHRDGTGKTASSTPYLCRRRDETTMALAGLWETWTGPNGEEVDTACIVTTEANGVSVAIHPRLPVVIEATSIDLWLDPDEANADAAQQLLRSPEDDILSFTPIGDAVNKVANDGPGIQVPVGPPVAIDDAAPAMTDKPAQPSLF